MTKDEILKVVEALPGEFKGVYCLGFYGNRITVQAHYDKDLAKKYASAATIDPETGYINAKTEIAGVPCEITLT